MLLILFSWFVIFIMIAVTGIMIKEKLKLDENNAFILLYGVIGQTFLAAFFAFFYKIGFAFFITNCILLSIFGYFIKDKIKLFFCSFLNNFDGKSKILLLIFTLITAIKSSQYPSIFDNETYYIQTIKWLNEYGYVKGLANLHPFLSQCSFWHVLQSGLNFSFLTNHLNDINGIILIIVFYYFFEKYTDKSKRYLFVNSIFLVFYIQFFDSPSPDLPILVFLSIIFDTFIFSKMNEKQIKALILFIIFIIFIKLTTIPFLLLLIYFVSIHKQVRIYTLVLGLIFSGIWITKNSIITGYPLFPLTFIDLNLEWKLPFETMTYMHTNINNLGYAENANIAVDYTIFEKLKFWIQLQGLNRIFNLGIIIMFVTIPFTNFFRGKYEFKLLYFILLIHFIFLLLNAPQYRFFLPAFILFSTIIIYEFLSWVKFESNNVILFFSSLALFFSISFDPKKSLKPHTFQLSQMILPKESTTYKNVIFKEIKIENCKFYSPNLPNLYETANGKLPCVNKKLFDYYSYYPQLRTNNMKDGFYSKKIKND